MSTAEGKKRTLFSAVAALAVFVTCGPAHALEASDTMAAWHGATLGVRKKLVADMLKQEGLEGSTASVLKCLDGAAEVPGHADLPIRKS